MPSSVLTLCAVMLAACATVAAAQAPAAGAPPVVPQAPAPAAPPAPGATPAGPPVADRQPPAGSGPVLRAIELAFPAQNNASVIEPATYLYYIQTRPSRPSENVWVTYNEQSLLEDFRRLWNTNFLDDLWIDVKDVPYPNGVVGRHVIINMEERQRIKIVDYVGTKVLEQTKIDEQLKEKGMTIKLDSFIDQGLINRVKSIVRGMLTEKGHLDGKISTEMKEVAGGPKLVHLTFTIDEGPKYKIRDIEFTGNTAISDGKLAKQMKQNKEQWFLSFITGRGTYQQDKFEEDADKIVEFYRDRGYIASNVGQPEVKTLDDADDGKTRFVQLRVPIREGERYRIGKIDFEGNTVVKTEVLKPLYALKEGEYYSEKTVRKGLEKARELYGSGGYYEFTAYPDLKPRDVANSDDEALSPTPAVAAGGPPLVDLTMKVQEGKQYFVNRLTFTGNTTTRDNVIRREVRLFEGAPFNTEALKFSVKRLNQLGYFKNLEGDAIQVEKTPNEENKIDVTLKLEEQNRNQLTFGAGVSQYEGFFGQLSFQTANFLGRGETFSVGISAGSRSQNYQLAFTEPFLFDRPITGGIDVYKREVRYPDQFTQASTGTNIQFGFPLADFTRAFVGYSLERVKVLDLNDLYNDTAVISRNPFLADALLLRQGGVRLISKVTPSVVKNTIDNPIFPTAGRRYTASFEMAGLGGNTNYLKPRAEGVWMLRHTGRTSLGLRGQVEYIRPFGSTVALPLFERLILGGEYSVRGYDIRSIGPRDPLTGLVIGGNKSLLFNAEYLITIAGPVRLVLFYDAGQVRNFGQSFAWEEDILEVQQDLPLLYDPTFINPATGLLEPPLRDPNAPPDQIVSVGQRSAFKTSTGAEVRFFMPVLNVPFRLIFAYNPQRGGVLDNDLEPAKELTFKFAVGTTF